MIIANITIYVTIIKCRGKFMDKNKLVKASIIIVLVIMAFLSIILGVGVSMLNFSLTDMFKGLVINDDNVERLITFKTRLPMVLVGGLVEVYYLPKPLFHNKPNYRFDGSYKLLSSNLYPQIDFNS